MSLERCSIHQDKKLLLCCDTCNCYICHECLIWGQYHAGHTFIPLGEEISIKLEIVYDVRSDQPTSEENEIGATGGTSSESKEMDVSSPSTLFAELFPGYVKDESVSIMDDLDQSVTAKEGGEVVDISSGQSGAQGSNTDNVGDSAAVESTLVPEAIVEGGGASVNNETALQHSTD